jgi:hypothetical protein
MKKYSMYWCLGIPGYIACQIYESHQNLDGRVLIRRPFRWPRRAMQDERTSRLISFDTIRPTYKSTRPIITQSLPRTDRGIHIQTHRLMGGMYEGRRWEGLSCHDVHIKFQKDWFRHSHIHRHKDTQAAWWYHKPYLLIFGAEPFLRSKICSYSRISQHFMKPEGSLPCSQEPSTGLYPEPDHSSLSLRSILILFTHLRLGLPSGLLPSEYHKPTSILSK